MVGMQQFLTGVHLSPLPLAPTHTGQLSISGDILGS